MIDPSDSGNPLDALAGEYIDRLKRGEGPTIDEYIARHPELEDEIRAFFPALRFITGIGLSLDEANDPTSLGPGPGGPGAGGADATVEVALTPGGAGTHGSRPIAEGPGSQIGPYRLCERIGEGGMGVVYRAEQERPVRREVALKVIKPGMDTEQVVARFEAERQALALMDHSNIAKVFDAGATDAGRPYFVMEMVRGVPITDYCDAVHLTPRERLGLFLPVCAAVQHAHQKGIIHRDLKPSNVLVAMQDGRPVPKVIDFGIAKAVGQALTERSLFTQHGAIVGTLEYMSPEQAELSAQGVDTRADVYALGVMLYELLTGTTPLERARLRQAGYAEILRRIREEEPPKPSTRLSDSRETLPSVAALRRTEPSRLARFVRGELDWIVMKALEKDRTRRYESANGLARDIARFLADEPVEASPPSRTYRLRKFLARHKASVTTAAAVALILVAATVFSAVQASRARTAGKASRDAAGKAEKARTASAKSEADTKAVLTFVREKILAAARPKGEPGALGRDVKLREAIEAAEPAIARDFRDRPQVEAAIRETLGESLGEYGAHSKAIEQFRKEADLRERFQGRDHPETLAALFRLAQSMSELNEDAPGAIRRLEDVARRQAAVLGPRHRDTLRTRATLAYAHLPAGRPEVTRQILEEILPDLRAARPYETSTFSAMCNLGEAYRETRRPDLALKLQAEAVDLMRRHLGPEHSLLYGNLNGLARLHGERGDMTAALPLLEEASAGLLKTLGPDHAYTIAARGNLASVYLSQGRAAEAIPIFEDQIRRRGGAEGSQFAGQEFWLGRAYSAVGRRDDAVRILRTMHDRARAHFPAGDPQLLAVAEVLAGALMAARRPADAVALIEPILASGLGPAPNAEQVRALMDVLADARGEMGLWPEAEATLRDLLPRWIAADPDGWKRHDIRSRMAAAIFLQRRFEEAEPMLLESHRELEARKDRPPAGGRDRARLAANRLVRFYDDWKKPDKAAEWRARAGLAPAELPREVFAKP